MCSRMSLRKENLILKGDFFRDFFFYYVRYSTLLHLPPLRFHYVGGCWDRTQDSCDYGIGCQTRLDLIHRKNRPLSICCSYVPCKVNLQGLPVNGPPNGSYFGVVKRAWVSSLPLTTRPASTITLLGDRQAPNWDTERIPSPPSLLSPFPMGLPDNKFPSLF
jgi:hypothetical protein